MARRSALLIAALGVAALGTLLIIMWVQGIDERATEDQELVKVLRATDVIDAGESLDAAQSAGKIESAEVNRVALAQDALSSSEIIEGKVALQTIYPGEQLLSAEWGEPGTEDTLKIPEENMAISVELADPDRVAGFVNPGSEIAIFCTAKDGKLIKRDGTSVSLGDYTRMIVPRTPVLGIGNGAVASRTTTTEEGESTTEEVPQTVLTVSVDQDEAEKVIHCRYVGSPTFALLTEKSDSEDERGAFPRDLWPELFRTAR